MLYFLPVPKLRHFQTVLYLCKNAALIGEFIRRFNESSAFFFCDEKKNIDGYFLAEKSTKNNYIQLRYQIYTSSPAWQSLFYNLIIQVIHLIPIRRLLSSTTSAAPRQWVHLDFHSFESHSAHPRPANNQHPWPCRSTVTTTLADDRETKPHR